MDRKNIGLRNLVQVVFSFILTTHLSHCNELKNHHPNHRHSLMTMSDLANHWIGIPKSPYVHFSSAITPTTSVITPPPTSAPISIKKISKPSYKPKKRKNEENVRRRSDSSITRKKDKNYYDDENDEYDYDYDYDNYAPSYSRVAPPPPSQYVIKGSTSPKTMYMNPSESSPSVNKIFAAVPKVATYVVPSSKTYVVRRVKSEAVYIPPTADVAYASSSKPGMRRQDPLEYDDNPSGLSYLGPRNSFPPKAVMNKITGHGQRQPCHGPECHQHHKGLVRFYWRRVIYPPGADGRRRRPSRFRNRRRSRDRARSPSDQTETFTSEEDDMQEESKEDIDQEEDPDENDEDEGAEETGKWRQTWRPGRAYGHDLDEGKYYENSKKTYRDKRFANRRRERPKFAY